MTETGVNDAAEKVCKCVKPCGQLDVCSTETELMNLEEYPKPLTPQQKLERQLARQKKLQEEYGRLPWLEKKDFYGSAHR